MTRLNELLLYFCTTVVVLNGTAVGTPGMCHTNFTGTVTGTWYYSTGSTKGPHCCIFPGLVIAAEFYSNIVVETIEPFGTAAYSWVYYIPLIGSWL